MFDYRRGRGNCARPPKGGRGYNARPCAKLGAWYKFPAGQSIHGALMLMFKRGCIVLLLLSVCSGCSDNTSSTQPAPILTAPNQVSPADGSVFNVYPRVTAYSWQPVAGAKGYRLELDYCNGRWPTVGPCQSDTKPPCLITGFSGSSCSYPLVFQSCAISGIAENLLSPGCIPGGNGGTTFTQGFVGAQPGRWKVWAVDSQGNDGPQSGWWTFVHLQ
jgi:hypothetical protein